MTSDMINPVLEKVVRKSTIPMDYEVFATDSGKILVSELDEQIVASEIKAKLRLPNLS